MEGDAVEVLVGVLLASSKLDFNFHAVVSTLHLLLWYLYGYTKEYVTKFTCGPSLTSTDNSGLHRLLLQALNYFLALPGLFVAWRW